MRKIIIRTMHTTEDATPAIVAHQRGTARSRPRATRAPGRRKILFAQIDVPIIDAGNNRDGRFDDASFFAGNQRQCAAKLPRVVEADAGNDADFRAAPPDAHPFRDSLSGECRMRLKCL